MIRTRRFPILLAAMAIALAGLPAMAAPSLSDYASPVQDLTAQSVIVSRDMDALKKISNEFAQSYRFASSTVYYKEPNKLRLDSKAGLIGVRYVINGNQKALKAGIINKHWDITNTPGQRQTALTVGLITPSFVDLVNVSYVGRKKVDGREAAVFDAHFKAEPKGAWYRLFMDPERRYVMRYEQYHGTGRLKVSMNLLAPLKANGVWMPTKTKVFNAQGQLGAVTELRAVRVNTGLSDDLFNL